MTQVSQHSVGHIDGGIFAVAGYYSDTDSMRHVVVATLDGSLYEMHWNSRTPTTAPFKLAQFPGLVGVVGFFAADNNSQYVLVATRDGNVHGLHFQSLQNIEVRSPLIFLQNMVAVIGMAGFFSSSDAMRHAIVLDQQGQLHEVTFSLSRQPVVKNFPTQLALQDIASISGFFASDDKSSHVIVALKNGRLYDGNYVGDPQNASATFLSTFADPLRNVAALFSADTNYRHAVVLTSQGDLYDSFYRSGGSTSQQFLTSFSNVADMVAFYTGDDQHRHVMVATNDGNIHEVHYPRLDSEGGF